MKQEHKLYGMLGAALVLGGLVYMVTSEKTKNAQARSGAAKSADLPTIKVAKEEADKVTKFVIKNKDADAVVLEKKGDAWVVSKPISAKANQDNVKSIVENLQKLEVIAVVGKDAALHERYDLTADKAVHVQGFKGDAAVIDMYFGKSGSRGGTQKNPTSQMARMGGEGAAATVFAVQGYSAFLWGREMKNWRHNEVLKFEDGNAIAAEVENKDGKFSFTKGEEAWTAKYYARDKDGELGKGKSVDEFDEAKVKDMLKAFKNLKATDFATAKDDTGVDKAIEHGGVIRVTMKDEDKPKYVLNVGKAQEGSIRFLKRDGDDTVYIVTSWAGDWASAKLDKFQKVDDGEAEGGDKKPGDKKPGDKKPEKKPAPAKAPPAKAPPAAPAK